MKLPGGWFGRGLTLGAVGSAVVATALIVGAPAKPGRAGSAAGPVAVAAAATPALTTTQAHTTTQARNATPVSAPTGTAETPLPEGVVRNTQSPDAPVYHPGVQRITLDMTEKKVEIAKGKVVTVWTFGDQVPGPAIRVRVGDNVQVTINNKATIPHSIDFHAARIAPNRAFRDVPPGESFSFSFVATSPGVFMYHCGTAPVVHHIANGMYGMIIVEPKGGLPPVDRELAFVQSEFYVGATPGATADDAKLMANAPDVVAFNGYAGQYKEHPITVKRGERIRVFVLAAGPNTWSAFHVVGTMFDKAWIDGIYPENLTRGNQTLNLAVSQGAVAEFRLDEEGVYPFVTHEFTNVAKGAVGLLRTKNAPTAKSSH